MDVPGLGIFHPVVTCPPVWLPTKNTRSASATARLAQAREYSPITPSASGCVSSMAPFALSEVATGIDSLSASAITSACAPDQVTPPPATGLPRLVAEAAQFTVGTSMAIQFAAQTTRDLTVATVQRGASALGSASVVIVGTLANPAGTIALGAASLDAVGEVRASAVTAANGDLPTLRVPAAPLHAVIFPGGAGDHAVTAIDLTSSVPTTINALATQSRPTQLTTITGTVLPGAILDAVPVGPLALAGAPTIHRVAGANGNLTIDLAPGAAYDLRLTDPNGNRGALAVVPGVTTVTINSSNKLSKATKVTATVLGSNPIPGAIVQFLCAACTGIDRSRPIAEGVTGIDGKFSLAVPDN